MRNRLSVPHYYLTDGRRVCVRAGSGRPKPYHIIINRPPAWVQAANDSKKQGKREKRALSPKNFRLRRAWVDPTGDWWGPVGTGGDRWGPGGTGGDRGGPAGTRRDRRGPWGPAGTAETGTDHTQTFRNALRQVQSSYPNKETFTLQCRICCGVPPR